MMIVISDTWLCSYVIHGYEGLVKPGYEGLGTLIRAAFQRPVQIVRQTISNLETGISCISAYHNYEGLSIAQHKGLSNYIVKHLGQGTKKDTHIPIGITNLISRCGGYVDMGFGGLL